ncbi:MAG: metalloregulator ArsR/SmtB family transcription factor [Anaerolineales bacterium]
MTPSERDRLSGWLKVLAEPRRLELFDLIVRGYQCNCQLRDELGLPANLISHHLGVLREAGLVDTERDPIDGRWVYYSVNRESLEALNHAWRSFFDSERIAPRRLTCGPQAATEGSMAAVAAELDPR